MLFFLTLFLGASSVKDVDMSAAPLVVKTDEDLIEIWPLHLLNLDDVEHDDLAFKLLSRVPAVIPHYLTGKAHLLFFFHLLLKFLTLTFRGCIS